MIPLCQNKPSQSRISLAVDSSHSQVRLSKKEKMKARKRFYSTSHSSFFSGQNMIKDISQTVNRQHFLADISNSALRIIKNTNKKIFILTQHFLSTDFKAISYPTTGPSAQGGLEVSHYQRRSQVGTSSPSDARAQSQLD